MKKIASFIVNHCKLFVIVYVLLAILSLMSIKNVEIEYDLSAYLPADMASYKGKQLLESEFQMGGMASVIVQSEDEAEMSKVAAEIAKVDGIAELIYIPGTTKEGYTLMDIVFSQGGSTKATSLAIDEIETILEGYTVYIGGESAIAKDMQDTTSREIILYSLVAFLIITIILVLGSSTYLEPVYFFIAIGVAILINMGSNIIFGKISSNTNSVASILQLAVSMDYSIFLLHRYYEEKKSLASKEAMAVAIGKTFGSVSASALTTIGGFLALVAMKYGIGKDMGLVLAKGVFFSLICVLTLLPALILLLDGKIKVKEHKIRIPSFEKLAKFFVKSRYIAFGIAVIIAIPAFMAHTKVHYYYSNEKTLTDEAKSIVATQKIKDTFGLNNQLIVMVPLEVKDKLKATMEEVNKIDGVKEAFGLYSLVGEKLPIEFIPKELVDKFQTEDYTYFAVALDRPMEGLETSTTLRAIQDVLDANLGNQYEITGEALVYDDLKTVTAADFNVVTLLSILIVGIILALTFKSISLPLILLFIIQLGIWINLSIPYMLGHELNFISFIILGAIQLGATVDYAILFTERYKENLGEMDKYTAMTKTIGDTSRSVLTSALILIAGTMSVYFITTIRSAAELTMLIARGSVISLVLVYILLPAVLLIFDKVIRKTTIGWPKSHTKS
ncbi:MAG: efflux RND transporter permease subunit [Cellulosilyticaceae bacterium]